MSQTEIIEQTKFAFEFIQKLYLEVSFLIKEIEGLLGKEDEEFIIGRSGGYAVSTNRSAGLEPSSVELWPMRKMAVFFVPKASTVEKGGVTNTPLDDKIRIVYLRIVLDGKGVTEPTVYSGVLFGFRKKDKDFPTKVEQFMTHIEYRETQVFKKPASIDYEDVYLSFKGELLKHSLFDLNSSDEISKKIIVPTLKLFRK